MRLFGKNPILERIKTNPRSIKKLYLQKRTSHSEIVRALKDSGLAFESVEKRWFDRNAPHIHTQGVLAEVEEFKYVSFSGILDECIEGKTIPVFLDGITDPQNLGSIIRNLACMGGFSIVLPEHRAAHVNETVLRVANGGENFVDIARVTNLSSTLINMKDADISISIVGAVIEESKSILETNFQLPMVVVMGSEGKGVRPGIQKHLDLRVSLPMSGAPLSFNVAVATTLFCYEIVRGGEKQGKRIKGKG